MDTGYIDDHWGFSPMVGIAPAVFLYSRLGGPMAGGEMGYSDLFQIYPNSGGEDQASGTIPYKQDTRVPVFPIGQQPPEYLQLDMDFIASAQKWRMKRDMQPGLARAVDSNVHTGYHWANVAKVSPDVVATGNVVTLRVGAGYIRADRFDQDGKMVQAGNQSDFVADDGSYKLPSDEGEYVHIGGGLVVKASNNADDVNASDRITILRDADGKLRQRLVADAFEPSLLQWIELDVEIGKDVTADVYDVNLNLGAVEGHTMTGALNIIKFPLDTVYQLEVASGEWGGIDDYVNTSDWRLELDAAQDQIVLLDPTSTNLNKLAETGDAPAGKKRYKFDKKIRALGTAKSGREGSVSIRVITGKDTFIDFPVLGVPLRIGQRVKTEDRAAPAQINGLLGVEGVLYVDDVLGHRDVDFNRFQWESLPGPDGRIAVKSMGPAGTKELTVHGWRPGANYIRATDPEFGELGRWPAICHNEVTHMPNLAQVEAAIKYANSADPNAVPPVDVSIEDADQLWKRDIANKSGVSHPASATIRNLVTHHRRAVYIVSQLTSAIDLPSDEVFLWSTNATNGFTIGQVRSLLGQGYYGDLTSSYGPKLKLYSRLKAFDQEQQNAAAQNASGIDNGDLHGPIHGMARLYADSALLDIMKERSSILFDPSNYVSYCGGAESDLAPGHNMYGTIWNLPEWWYPDFLRTARVLNVFSGLGVDNWKLSHPFTREVLEHMSADRADLAKFHAVAATGTNSQVILTVKDVSLVTMNVTYEIPVHIHDDLSWHTDWKPQNGGYETMFDGDYIFDSRTCRQYNGNPQSDGSHSKEYRGTFQGEGVLQDIAVASPSEQFPFARALAGAIKEGWVLERSMRDMQVLKGWQDWKDATNIGPAEWVYDDVAEYTGVTVLWVGTWFGADNMYQAVVGKEFVTNDQMTPTARLMSVAFAAMDVMQIAVPIAKAGGAGGSRILKGIGRSLSKAAGTEAQSVAIKLAQRAVKFGENLAEREVLTSATALIEKITEPINNVPKELLGDVVENILGRESKLAARAATVPGTITANIDLKSQGKHLVEEGIIERTAGEAAKSVTQLKNAMREMKAAGWTMDEIRMYFENACFVAGTPVKMASGGYKAIEDVKNGDRVASKDQYGEGGIVSANVVRTFVHQSDHIRILRLRTQVPRSRARTPHAAKRKNNQSSNGGDDDGGSGGETDNGDPNDSAVVIRTTDEHPFWIIGRGWSPARNICAGDIVAVDGNQDGVVCEWSSRETHPEGVSVYNLEVRGTHTYFVSTQCVWVHNLCKGEEEFLEFLRKAKGNSGIPTWSKALSDEKELRELYKKHVLQKRIIDGRTKATFKGFTRENININTRRNYEKNGVTILGDWDAHHIFPVDDEAGLWKLFYEQGINVNDPKYAVLLGEAQHEAIHPAGWNHEWIKFFKGGARTQADILAQGRKMAKNYGITLPPFWGR